jgi:opacity protein-like surface antigen
MRRELFCAIVPALWATAVVASGSAFAADFPVKAPPMLAPVAVSTYDWTGFYVGGNAGYSWGHVDTALSIFDPAFPNCHFCGPGLLALLARHRGA